MADIKSGSGEAPASRVTPLTKLLVRNAQTGDTFTVDLSEADELHQSRHWVPSGAYQFELAGAAAPQEPPASLTPLIDAVEQAHQADVAALRAELEAERLKSASLQESIDGCGQKVASLRAERVALKAEVNEGLIERHGRWQARVDDALKRAEQAEAALAALRARLELEEQEMRAASTADTDCPPDIPELGVQKRFVRAWADRLAAIRGAEK